MHSGKSKGMKPCLGLPLAECYQVLSVCTLAQKSSPCEYHNSYISSDQQDHLAQRLVSNWPLADAEGRVGTGQAVMPLILGGMGLEDAFFLLCLKKKKTKLQERD